MLFSDIQIIDAAFQVKATSFRPTWAKRRPRTAVGAGRNAHARRPTRTRRWLRG